MDNKDDIDKLDEQINSLLNKDEEEPEREVIIDRRYAYDDVGDGDTKRLDKIDSIPEEKEESKESRVERLERQEKEHQSRVERLEEEKQEEPEEMEEEIPKEKMPKKKKIIIISSIIGLILLIIIILLVALNKNKKIDTEAQEKLSKSEQKEIIEDYGDALKATINAYYEKQHVLLEYADAIKLVEYDEYKVKCNKHEIYKDGEIYLDECSINKIKTSYSYGTKQEEKAQEKDDKIKVYVNKETQKATLKTPDDLKKYDIYGLNIDDTYSDLTLLSEQGSDYVYYVDKDNNVHMVNYKTGVKALNPLNYTSILSIKNEGETDLSYVAVEMNDLWGIYNLETRERIVNHNYKNLSSSNEIKHYLETIELDIMKAFDGEYYGLINYKTGKIVIPIVYKSVTKKGNYVLVLDSNSNYHVLDFNNREYLKDYDKIYGFVCNQYALVKDEESVKLVKADGKEVYDYGPVEIKYSLRTSSCSDNEALFLFHADNKTNDDKDSEYLQITYNTKNKKGRVELLEYSDVFK